MLINEKIAPLKFKSEVKKIPLAVVVDYISFSCILIIERDNDTGILFFKNGKLINAGINNNFHIDKAKDIMNWQEGTYFYQKWTNDFEIEIKHISNVLRFIELNGFDTELSFISDGKFIKIFCSEGVIVGIEPNQEDIKLFFNNILQETKGNIRIKNKGGQTGDLKEYFSEIISPNKKIEKQQSPNKETQKTPSPNNTILDNNSIIETGIIEELFNNLQNDLGDQFLAGSFYSANTGKPIYRHNTNDNQSVLFIKLHKTVNNLLANENFSLIKNFYLFDLEENYLLLILTFKEHHFGLAFDSKKVKLGYLFNIIKPLITNDYNNALEQKTLNN